MSGSIPTAVNWDDSEIFETRLLFERKGRSGRDGEVGVLAEFDEFRDAVAGVEGAPRLGEPVAESVVAPDVNDVVVVSGVRSGTVDVMSGGVADESSTLGVRGDGVLREVVDVHRRPEGEPPRPALAKRAVRRRDSGVSADGEVRFDVCLPELVSPARVLDDTVGHLVRFVRIFEVDAPPEPACLLHSR